MGLAVDNIRLLTLTARKADCEYDISIDSMRKMALTREQSELSQEYYSRLQSKNISYYANGKYYNMNYAYLMGAGTSTSVDLAQLAFGRTDGVSPLKKDNSMVLTDLNGRVVINDAYATVLMNVLGSSCINSDGIGSTFSVDKIPALIAEVGGAGCTEDDVKTVLNNGGVKWGFDYSTVNTMSGETTSTGNNKESDSMTSVIQSIVNFYYPIFLAAATNGWTTEYNKDMQNNDNYVSDALVSGIFYLEQVDSAGEYKPDASLTYFVTSGLVLERNDSSAREEVTAWYNAEKDRISAEESWLDLDISNLSTELEAINTEIKTIEELISNDTEAFNWCNG